MNGIVFVYGGANKNSNSSMVEIGSDMKIKTYVRIDEGKLGELREDGLQAYPPSSRSNYLICVNDSLGEAGSDAG